MPPLLVPPPSSSPRIHPNHPPKKQSYDVVHSLRFTGPLLSVGLSPNKARLMVGKADGTLAVRIRRAAAKEMASTAGGEKGGLAGALGGGGLKKPIFGGTTRYFQRGKNAVAGQGDFQVRA